jgi:hypothetical protein
MSLAGLGAVAIWHDLLPAAKDDFYEWHNREHMPERVGIPGFRRGRRFVAISGAPEFFNLYEADSPETLSGQDYLNRLNAPTAWTQRVIPSFRNVARSICRVAFTNGVGSGGVMLTLRFAIDAAHRDSTIDALRRRLLPPLVYRKGVAGVHLCLADDAATASETAERKVRADTIPVPSWIILIEASGCPMWTPRRRSRAHAHGARSAGPRARDLSSRVHAPQDAVERGLTISRFSPESTMARAADRIRRCVARSTRGLRRHHGHPKVLGQQFHKVLATTRRTSSIWASVKQVMGPGELDPLTRSSCIAVPSPTIASTDPLHTATHAARA